MNEGLMREGTARRSVIVSLLEGLVHSVRLSGQQMLKTLGLAS